MDCGREGERERERESARERERERERERHPIPTTCWRGCAWSAGCGVCPHLIPGAKQSKERERERRGYQPRSGRGVVVLMALMGTILLWSGMATPHTHDAADSSDESDAPLAPPEDMNPRGQLQTQSPGDTETPIPRVVPADEVADFPVVEQRQTPPILPPLPQRALLLDLRGLFPVFAMTMEPILYTTLPEFRYKFIIPSCHGRPGMRWMMKSNMFKPYTRRRRPSTQALPTDIPTGTRSPVAHHLPLRHTVWATQSHTTRIRTLGTKPASWRKTR